MSDHRKSHRIHDEAVLDLRLAARWYEQHRRGLGAELVLAVDDAITRILEAPDRWPLSAGVRRYVLRRFPYTLIYRIEEPSIQVLAVAHQSRRPVYWRRRG